MSHDFTELDYLRYMHRCLDIETIIKIQRNYNGPILPFYKISSCEDCEADEANYECKICRQKLCGICTFRCAKENALYCETHFSECPICNINCACEKCRVYSAEYTCEICSEEFEVSFSCGCTILKENCCVICQKEFCPITKQRI